MRSKLLFLIVLILAMAALSGTVFANMAVNESFETGSGTPDDWNTWGSSGWNIGETYHEDDGFARTGVDCIELSRDGYGFHYQDHGASADATGNVAVVVGQDYTVGAYFKDIHPGGSTGPVAVTLEYRDGPRIGGTKLPTQNYETNIPNNGQWHLVYLTYTTPATTELITIAVGSGAGDSTYLYDDVWFNTYPPGLASDPDPATNSKVQAPGTVDLKWENQTAQTCTVYWDDGSADVNDLNFQWHIDTASPKVTDIGTVANDDPNQILGKAVAAAKVYHWRVDVGSLAGLVWKFSTTNSAPDVDAGPKQALWLADGGGPVTFQLAPTVSDDGLPIPPGTVTYLWTKTAGSGAVTFTPGGATSTSLAPTVTMSDPCAVGDYELTLTVSDGSALTGSDTVKIRVHANDTTGLEALYDCEEGNGAAGIHDDWSGAARNPITISPGVYDYSNGTRRGERMDDIDTTGMTATTMDTTGGHWAQPEQDPCDLTLGGITFDGLTGHVEASNSSGDPNFESAGWADFRDEVSLAAWIKVDTENGGWDDNWEAVINKGEQSYRLHRNGSGDSIQMTVNIDGEESIAEGTTAVNDGEWYHVMGTYDGAEVCIYIDGLEEACVDAEGLIDWESGGEDIEHALTIGQSKEYDAPFGGIMDEIRVHSIGLPWQSDNPEAAPIDAGSARSVVSIYRTSGGHVNCGGIYLPGDADEDCYVDLKDVNAMAGNWMKCNSIANPYCD